MAHWVSMLRHVEPRDHPEVIELFEKLARFESPGGTLPHTVFNSLIQHEEYAVFVEVFDAYHELLAAQRKEWFGITTPAPRCLKLELPPDWRCQFAVDLRDALRAARVNELVVLMKEPADLVPEAVCECIVDLLPTDLLELKIFAPLASPLKVSEAMKHSHLRALSLGAMNSIPAGSDAWRSYEILLAGTTSADRLHTMYFSFSPSEYLALVPILKACLNNGLPGLTHVSVATFSSSERRNDALPLFVGALVNKQSLRELNLTSCHVDEGTWQELEAVLLTNKMPETVLLPNGRHVHERTAVDAGPGVATTAHPVVTTGTSTGTAAPNTTTPTVSLGAQALRVAEPSMVGRGEPGTSGNTSAPSRPMTDEEIFDGWTSKFRHTAAGQNQNTLHLLATLACDELPGESAESAALKIDIDAAFCDLIEREEYAVFVDVFEAYQQLRLLRHRQQGDGGAPPLRSLHLQLRSAWSCRRENELQDALRRARIQSLTVQAWEDNGVVSQAACGCIVILLRAGLVELEIFDAVAAPDALTLCIRLSGLEALALSTNPALLPSAVRKDVEARGLTVLPPSSNAAPLGGAASDAAWGNYAKLVAGLAGCKTLRSLHLGFSPTQLYLLMSPLFAAAKPRKSGEPGLPRLATIEVATGPIVTSKDTLHAKLFMQVVAEFKTLEVFELVAKGIDAACFEHAFVSPLTAHRSLREFRVDGVKDPYFTEASMNLLSKLAALADTCKSLTHVQCASPLDTEAAMLAMKTYLFREGDRATEAGAAATKTWLMGPTCRIRVLVVQGQVLTPSMLRGIIDALAHNTSVEVLDLSRCLLELKTLLNLLRALRTNTTLKKIVLPDDWGYYYGASKDGKAMARLRPGPIRSADTMAVFAPPGQPAQPNAWGKSVGEFFEHYESGFVHIPRVLASAGDGQRQQADTTGLPGSSATDTTTATTAHAAVTTGTSTSTTATSTTTAATVVGAQALSMATPFVLKMPPGGKRADASSSDADSVSLSVSDGETESVRGGGAETDSDSGTGTDTDSDTA